MSPIEYADAYLARAAMLRDAVRGMSREQLLARPVPGKWSTLEVIVHIADFETVYVDRILRMLALDKPLMLGASENDFAANLNPHGRDAEEELAVVDALCAKVARLLRGLTPAHLQRTGVHSERGLLTLAQLLDYAIAHVPHHVKHVAEKRKALGLPVS